MSTFASMMIPKRICDEIECIVRQFIWGFSDGCQKMSLVNWESICQPRSCRGLGIGHLRDQNASFMMKLGCNLVYKQDALWVRVLRSKYGMKDAISTSTS
ncbi:hypothetical protein J1N35_016931 [Gossypium stocksii]|uniref:Reverse transcriptase zinc-binding domain-containing protein n=1 Tax=Gossypium stocksii TaxID=47602 RepID=A0A9D3VLI5_9ROSI|nr:hypothetical protein J1N35_016931 [Gossypium stocksii]